MIWKYDAMLNKESSFIVCLSFTSCCFLVRWICLILFVCLIRIYSYSVSMHWLSVMLKKISNFYVHREPKGGLTPPAETSGYNKTEKLAGHASRAPHTSGFRSQAANSTVCVPLGVWGYLHYHCSHFKVNHIYSYGSNLFSAESVRKLVKRFHAQFNLNWLLDHEHLGFFSPLKCGFAWWHWVNRQSCSAIMIPFMSLISTVAWASSSRDSSSMVPVRAAWCRAEKLREETEEKHGGRTRQIKSRDRWGHERVINHPVAFTVRPFAKKTVNWCVCVWSHQTWSNSDKVGVAVYVRV